MRNEEMKKLIETLQTDEQLREMCFQEIGKKNGDGAVRILEKAGMDELFHQSCRHLVETTEQIAGADIYAWSGKYHFSKPEKYKKSILRIDGERREVTVNDKPLHVETVEKDTYSLSSEKRIYRLKFYSEGDEDFNKFKGHILSEQKTEDRTEESEETEGTQEEWYETPAAEEFSMAMTVIGVFDLALSLVLLAKDCISKRKEGEEQRQQRQDIEDTRAKMEEVGKRIERAMLHNSEVAARQELMRKSVRLAELLDESIMSKVKKELDDSMRRHENLQEADYREAVFQDVKNKIQGEYEGLLRQELRRYGERIKETHFEAYGLNYDSGMEESTIHEISENTYEYLKQKEWIEDYCLDYEITKELADLKQKHDGEVSELQRLRKVKVIEGTRQAIRIENERQGHIAEKKRLEEEGNSRRERRREIRERMQATEIHFRKRRR